MKHRTGTGTADRFLEWVTTRPETRRGRITWAIGTLLAALVFSLIAFTVWPDASHGAVAPPDRSSQKVVTSQRLCAPGECPLQYPPHFNAGDYGNSHGLRLPLKVRKMLRALDGTTSGVNQRGFGDWWESAMGYGRCISHVRVNMLSNLNCIGTDDGQEYLDGVFTTMWNTQKVYSVCGGAAVIGATRGGGWWGAGKGGGTCLWVWGAKKWMF
jgi:hypothetical protein